MTYFDMDRGRLFLAEAGARSSVREIADWVHLIAEATSAEREFVDHARARLEQDQAELRDLEASVTTRQLLAQLMESGADLAAFAAIADQLLDQEHSDENDHLRSAVQIAAHCAARAHAIVGLAFVSLNRDSDE